MARPMTAVRAVGYTSSESEWSYLFEKTCITQRVPENVQNPPHGGQHKFLRDLEGGGGSEKYM